MSKLARNILIFLSGLLLLVWLSDPMITGRMQEQENAIKQQKAELEAKMAQEAKRP